MREAVKVLNPSGEAVDVLISGNPASAEVNVFVHGLGTNKNEGFRLFGSLSEALKDNFINVQFDISGFGDSEGLQEDFCLSKAAQDLQSVLMMVTRKFEKPVNIIAHSFGAYIVSYLDPQVAGKIIYTSAPRLDSAGMADGLKDRIVKAGGELNVDGISIYPRTSGEVHKIGANFFKDMAVFNPRQAINNMKGKDNLTIFSPLQDEIVKSDAIEVYCEMGITCHAVNGDHGYTEPADRAHLIKMIKEILA